MPTTAAPTPPIDPDAYYLIENMGVGSCLSYWEASAGPGTCATPGDTDGWRYYTPQPGDPFELINRFGGYCLGEQSVKGGVPDVAICSGAPGQQWRRGYVGSNGGSFVNVESGLCLAATGSVSSGTIELESCNKQLNEVWQNSGMI